MVVLVVVLVVVDGVVLVVVGGVVLVVLVVLVVVVVVVVEVVVVVVVVVIGYNDNTFLYMDFITPKQKIQATIPVALDQMMLQPTLPNHVYYFPF